jgi:hypothetical protein
MEMAVIDRDGKLYLGLEIAQGKLTNPHKRGQRLLSTPLRRKDYHLNETTILLLGQGTVLHSNGNLSGTRRSVNK